jgi:hypothetical protein
MCESRSRVAVCPTPREAGNGWVLDAVFPSGKQAAIAGFRTESDANAWLGSADHAAWLRNARTTFCGRSAVAIFAWLNSCALVLSDVTTPAQLCASAYRRLSVATVALLILGVLGILVAVLATLGHSEQPTRLSSAAIQITADSPIVPAHAREVTEAFDPIAHLIDAMSSAEITTEPAAGPAETASPQSAEDERPAGDIHAATLPHDLRRAAPATIVGVWAPETGSCSARSARDGVVPAIISERGARAGETACVFKERRRNERDWRVLANCTNGHEHWTSNVRLIVKGDRLVWMSKRGTQAYTRCRSNI